MINIFFFKEWLKTKRLVYISTAAIIVMSIYIAINFQRSYTITGANELWEYMLKGRDSMSTDIEFLPLIVGIVLALSQYIPEMHNKCLKLTLHLPVHPMYSLYAMLGYGVVVLITQAILSICAIEIGILHIFLHEIRYSIVITIVPWYLGGIAAYLLSAWIILEPSWKRRILYLLLAIPITSIYYLTSTPGAYGKIMPLLILFTPTLSLLAPMSVYRFKEGNQD
jgi:hypothetical protein